MKSLRLFTAFVACWAMAYGAQAQSLPTTDSLRATLAEVWNNEAKKRGKQPAHSEEAHSQLAQIVSEEMNSAYMEKQVPVISPSQKSKPKKATSRQ